MFKKILAGIAVAAFMLFGTAVPAQAAYNDCAAYSNVVCFHQFSDYTGTVWRQTPAQIGSCKNVGAAFDNKASTAFNTTAHYAVIVYQLENCSGAEFTVGSGYSYVFTGSANNSWWDNRISSVEVVAL
jgi:hypothetical protein